MSSNLLQVAEGIAAGQLWVLVGENGVPVNVTDDGALESRDLLVQGIVGDSVFGNEALYNILNTGVVSIDLDAIIEDLGDPSSRADLKSIEAIIGWQDTPGVQPIADVMGAGGSGRYKTGGSIGADFDNLLNTRLDGTRAGYIDILNSATVGLSKVATEMSGAGTNGTFSYLVAGAEQDVIEFSKTNIYSILSFMLDLTNFTADRVLTIKVYAKVDGANYQQIDEVDYTVGTHDIVYVSSMLNLDHNVKFTMTINTVEAGNIDVPYRYVLADFT